MYQKSTLLSKYYTPKEFAQKMAFWGIVNHVCYNLGIKYTTNIFSYIKENFNYEGRSVIYHDIIRPIRIIDPCCGTGNLLVASQQVLSSLYTCCNIENSRPVDITSNISNNIYGVDIDVDAVEECRKRVLNPGNIYIGNSLIGLTVQELKESGYPKNGVGISLETKNNILVDKFFKLGVQVKDPIISDDGSIDMIAIRDIEDDDVIGLNPFHWGSEFTSIFNNGGFDVVLCNPPWATLQSNIKDFLYNEGIDTNDLSSSAISTLRKSLFSSNKDIANRYVKYINQISCMADYLRYLLKESNIYSQPYAGADNLFSAFIQRSRSIARNGGSCIFLVPSGIETDVTCKGIRECLFNDDSIQWSYTTYNANIFKDVTNTQRFTLLALNRGVNNNNGKFYHACREYDSDELRLFPCGYDAIINIEDIKKWYPSLTIPQVDSRIDIDILNKISNHPNVGSFNKKVEYKKKTGAKSV